MRTIAIPSLLLVAIVAGFWTSKDQKAQAATLTDSQGSYEQLETVTIEVKAESLTRDRLMAQMFYPSPSDRQGVMVQGQGEASASADTARITLQFTSSINPFEPPPEGSPPPQPVPLTEASVQPIVNALVANGVPADAIEVTGTPSSSPSFPFPFPLPGSGDTIQMVVTLAQPTRSRVQQIVTTASDAASVSDTFSVQSVKVEYTVNDCQALEREAYIAAVKDAQNRARALAEALQVEIRAVPSVAESPLSGFFPFSSASSSSCDSKPELSFFPFNVIQQPYDPAAPAEVRIQKDIFVTYPIR